MTTETVQAPPVPRFKARYREEIRTERQEIEKKKEKKK